VSFNEQTKYKTKETHMNIRKLVSLILVAVMLSVLAACEETFAPPKSSEELNGTSNDSSYTNDYLGFNMAYPEGYTALTKEKIGELFIENKDFLKAQFKDPKVAEEAIKSYVPVAMALKHTLDYTGGFIANINLIIKKEASWYTKDIVSLAKKYIEVVNKQSAVITHSEVQGIKLDGIDVAFVDATQTQKGFDLMQRQYYFARKDYIVAITITASESGEKDELVKAVEAIKFYDLN
jgi:hypothetical protein